MNSYLCIMIENIGEIVRVEEKRKRMKEGRG